ncbi:hypothetical protein [Jatrophihabitans sp.]|jgi:hypothetical protein|uniref:hypothetical protein n=1 Tax=Jatrophihabitans sp. TaxID=1932789 RepID=UPI002EFD1DAA
MHPADVAEHVAASVEVLRERLSERPELGAGTAVLEDDVRLYIPFTVRVRQMVDTAVPSSLLGPGGVNLAFGARVVLLGAPPEERALLLAMDLTDYDAQPPTAELLLPDRSPLPATQWPKSLDGQGVVPGHRDYDRLWFCRRGLREYHTHHEHEDDPWDRHREGLALHSVVEELLHEFSTRFIGN